MRPRRPPLHFLFLVLSIVACIWLGTANYKLSTLLHESEVASQQQSHKAQQHILQLDTLVTQLHSNAEDIQKEYTSISPQLELLLKKQNQEHKEIENKLKETEIKKDGLEKQVRDILATMEGEHAEQINKVSKKFKNGTIDLSVIVAYDWENSAKHTRSLSLLYIIDYFNIVASKNNLKIELVFVHPSKASTSSPSPVITNNMVSEFKASSSDSLEELMNEGAKGARGKRLLFIPVVASASSNTLDIELHLEVQKMMALFSDDAAVGMVGGAVENMDDRSLVNAGIHFAYAHQDSVIPYARFAGAGLHYPKKVEKTPCVSKNGMMIDRDLFGSLGGFSGKYTKDDRLSPLGHLMEDGDLCLQVLERSRKVIYIPESRIRTTSSSVTQNKPQGGLITKFNTTWFPVARKIVEAEKIIPNFMLVWDLYCGCTGVNVEAISYLVALEGKIDVGAVAGDGCWCGGFPTYVQESLLRISNRKIGPNVDVWVSHKPPDKYPSFPYKGLVTVETRPKRIIGRSMSETDSIKAKWVENSIKVDEIWVPTEFHREVFSSSGIDNSKLVVIEESLDTTLYHPEHTTPLPLEARYLNTFKFLSVFKWEARKGWDVLLQGYFEEFSAADNVVLVLQTYLYGDKKPRDRKRVEDRIKAFASTLKLNDKQLPPVLVLTDELPELKMPQLYKSCDAFVLPTRGEGWGLPVMEAMSMELPSIVTNWSGPTQFTTKDTAYLLPFDELETVPANFEGGSGKEKWAKPSLPQLKKMMREIYTNPKAAQGIGKRARKHIVDNYDREIIAEKMVERLKAINDNK